MSGTNGGFARYAEIRKNYKYYQEIKNRIDLYSPGESILDVGPGGTDVIYTGEFAKRTVVNRDRMNVEYPGVEVIIGDWLTTEIGPHEVVTCCQVIEHIPNAQVHEFTAKLLATATRSLIISVPFSWPPGTCKTHFQDPIDREKLARIMGQEPDHTELVRDGAWRLVAEYSADGLECGQR